MDVGIVNVVGLFMSVDGRSPPILQNITATTSLNIGIVHYGHRSITIVVVAVVVGLMTIIICMKRRRG